MRLTANHFHHRFIYYSLLFSLFLIGNIVAQQITPSHRVTHHVNVRENPDTQSDIVGMLRANDSAELLESVPYWYKVKLDDQTVGRVNSGAIGKSISNPAS